MLARNHSVRQVDEDTSFLPLLEGELPIPEHQLLDAYYIAYGKKVYVIVTITNYRMFIKSHETADTIWVPFKMIDQIRKEHSEINLVCKDARSITLLVGNNFDDKDACQTFYTKIKEMVDTDKLDESFAYQHKKVYPYPDEGWHIYKPKEYFNNLLKDFKSDTGEPLWTISNINENYELSSSYPAVLVLPTAASDPELIKQVAKFRSKGRIPTLCWKHPTRSVTMCRCSQPGVGLTFSSSTYDKQLIEAIRNTNISSSTLYFIDARPKINAMGNILGPSQGGFEYGYKNCPILFQNIENIHEMRNAWSLLCNLIMKSVIKNDWDDSKWASELEATGWLKHIRTLLAGAIEVVAIIEKNNSVVIHCSDGWDRTAQIASLTQLIIDPYFRTMAGFQILIEKEWCSFGHRFASRVGHVMNHSYSNDKKEKARTERGPIFLQWLDCIWQMMNQYPDAFEFNEEFLICLADALYDCRFGTFLENTEKARKSVQKETVSLWSWVNRDSNRDTFINPVYFPHSGVIWPTCSSKIVRLWENYWLRWDPDHRPNFFSEIARRSLVQKAKTTNSSTKKSSKLDV